MKRTSRIFYFLITILFFILINRFFTNLVMEKADSLYLNNSVFNISFVTNTGAAFNILEEYTAILIIIALVATGSLLFYVIRNINKFSLIFVFFISILISGIVCNMYERIELGYVKDFIKLNFINFPIFNISDIFINIGVLAIIIITIKNAYLKKL